MQLYYLNLKPILEFSFNSMGLFVGSWSPLVSHWLFCTQWKYVLPLVVHAEGSVWFDEGQSRFIEAKLKVASLDMPKWVSPSMNWYRTFFIQTSTLSPSMHRKLTKHGRSCMQNNHLPTKSFVELEDNSIVWYPPWWLIQVECGEGNLTYCRRFA